jgi:REP-associated tyrosine transposase
MSRNYNIRNQDNLHFLTCTVIDWVNVFDTPLYAQVIVDSFNYCIENKGLELYAWCLMPNHLHFIGRGKDGIRLQDIIRDFKKFTPKRTIEAIFLNENETQKSTLLNKFESAGKVNNNNTYHQFWQQHNHPIELDTNDLMDQKLNYIHMNPVKASLIDVPEEYPYSSAIDYAGGQGLINVLFIQ